jgi:hypothetical protein
MKQVSKTFTVHYKLPEVGEIITVTSTRSSLEVGKSYKVEKVIDISFPGDSVVVFVEGHKIGIVGEYIMNYDKYLKTLV